MKAAQTPVAPRENPLVPFALMKRMYAGMVETRLLEAFLAKRNGAGKRSPILGQEACRVAVLLNLEQDDLVADSTGAASSTWLRGADLGEIVTGRFTGLLPLAEGIPLLLGMALGAAASCGRAKPPRVVTVFLPPGTKRSSLRPVLSAAAAEELPLLLVAFASATGQSVAAESTKLGVPGIPVDAHDAVAICRVAQESILRARAGGGPALIECVRLEEGKRAPDPVEAMRAALLRLGACDRAWLDGVAPAFRARLKARKRERPSRGSRTMV